MSCTSGKGLGTSQSDGAGIAGQRPPGSSPSAPRRLMPLPSPVIIGNATLYCGDCLEILPHLKGVDAVVTDPPYALVNKWGVADKGRGRGRRWLEFPWDEGDSATTVLTALRQALLLKPWSAFLFTSMDIVSAVSAEIRNAGMTPKPFAWVKTCPPPPMPGNWWPSAFDICLYAYRSGAWFGHRDGKRKNIWTGDALRNGNREKVGHPNQKPIALLEHILTGLAMPKSTVLDPFAGSGSTGVACVTTGRKFIGIEIDEDYFKIACARIEKAQRQIRMEFEEASA